MIPKDTKSTVVRYLAHCENALNGILSDVAQTDSHNKAQRLLEHTRIIRQWLELAEPEIQRQVATAIAYAVTIEGMTHHALSERIVDAYLERVERIRKTPTLTADDLKQAEEAHSTRSAQALSLGISPRHLRRLRKQLLG